MKHLFTNSFIHLPFALVIIAGIGYLDYLTGYQIGISIFYLIPISLVIWFGGMFSGFLTALLSTVVWLMANIKSSAVDTHYIILYWNAAVRMGYFFIVAVILSRLKHVLDRERRLARKDILTGLNNGVSFYESLTAESHRCQRFNRPMSLAYIDCDNFKAVNDRFGHQTGNRLLVEIARCFDKSLRGHDTASRLGGDEFIVLFPEESNEEAVIAVQRIKDDLKKIMQDNHWDVTFSIGVVTFLKPLSSMEEMVKIADELMYEAKKHGKNQIKSQTISR